MPRGLDHLVLAVRDLDAAGTFYESLGFRVGARNRHPWGTENRIVQFPGSFLELITIGQGARIPSHAEHAFSFGAFIGSYLRGREGFAMLALESHDAKADAAAFKAAGIGDFAPFFFDRHGKRPDGSDTYVAFTLAFARDELAPRAGFFVSQQHHPENFWNADFQRHPNGAKGLAAVAMVAENPTDHHIFLSAFTGERELDANSFGVSVTLPRGRIDILTPVGARALFGPGAGSTDDVLLIAFTVVLDDLEAIGKRLAGQGIGYATIGGRIVVPAEACFGTAIAFDRA